VNLLRAFILVTYSMVKPGVLEALHFL